jgi:hypothetical protein
MSGRKAKIPGTKSNIYFVNLHEKEREEAKKEILMKKKEKVLLLHNKINIILIGCRMYCLQREILMTWLSS